MKNKKEDDTMNEAQKHLDEAFRLLSTISVKGDDVESMAAAKSKLRVAYSLIEEKETEKNG
jgi:hypothetical protein